MMKSGRKKKEVKDVAIRVSMPAEIFEIISAQAKHERLGLSAVCLRAIKNRLIHEKFLPDDEPERLK